LADSAENGGFEPFSTEMRGLCLNKFTDERNGILSLCRRD
jgi:hypothetical protein